MKKALIFGAASTLALAAMPATGAFAAYNAATTDDVMLTVNASCSMTVTDGDDNDDSTDTLPRINLGEITAGAATASATNGDAMTISCNEPNGWTLKATATALGNPTQASPVYTIPFGAFPASEAIGQYATPSVWSAAIALSGNDTAKAAIQTGWGDFSSTTASSTTILTSTTYAAGDSEVTGGSATAGDVKAVSGLVVTPSYKAYASNTQQAGSYYGTMTYNFAVNEN